MHFPKPPTSLEFGGLHHSGAQASKMSRGYQTKQEPEYVFSPFDSDDECKGQAPAGYVTCTSQDNTLFTLIDWNPKALVLYVWNLKTCDRIIMCCQRWAIFQDCWTYTITNEKHQVLVISTQNRQIVWHIPKSQLGPENPGALVANQERLNDITFSASPTVPLIYVDHGTSTQVYGVRFYPTN